MKKIVALGAIAALAGGMIFAEPVFEPSVTLSGEAKVEWGMDLDAGKTGFKNSTGGDFKVKLWGDGSRELEKGDGIWAELKSTGKEATINKGTLEGGAFELNEAKLHINDFYIGIKSGDTVLGSYKFAGAIRGDDGAGSEWVTNEGPAKYTQGIVAGYGNDNFGIDVDFRSLEDASTQYTNSYAVAAEAQLKDSNEWVGGLAVKAGAAYQLSNEYYTKAEAAKAATAELDATAAGGVKITPAVPATGADNEVLRTQYGGASATAPDGTAISTTNGHVLGYGASASYKLPVGDYYLKPAVAFAGAIKNGEYSYGDNKTGTVSINNNQVAFGVMFGFGGDKADNPGVPFLGGDESKKSEPGVSVVVGIPLATTTTIAADKTYKTTTYDAALAYIIPSFYTNGNFVPNLKAGVYSEIVPLRYFKKDGKVATSDANDDKTDVKKYTNAKSEDGTLALGLAAGLSYKVEIDAGAITPRFGIRYANAAYVDNAIASASPLKNDAVFKDMGEQAVFYKETGDNAYKNKTATSAGLYDGDFFNLKAGVDINVIDNTTFFVDYASANLLNKIDFKAEKAPTDGNPNYKIGSGAGKFGFYNQKLGTLNIGCKIAF